MAQVKRTEQNTKASVNDPGDGSLLRMLASGKIESSTNICQRWCANCGTARRWALLHFLAALGKLKTAELISPGAFCQSCLCGTLGPLPSYSSLSIFLFLLEAWFRSGVTRSGLFGLRCCLWLHWFLSGCLDWERQKVKAHGGEYPDGLPGLAGVLQTRVHGE